MTLVIYVLVMQLHAGGVSALAAFTTPAECEAARERAAGNVAADFKCDAISVDGFHLVRNKEHR